MLFLVSKLMPRFIARSLAVILLGAPILLLIITTASFDPTRFARLPTMSQHIGLKSRAVGLSHHVINSITPDFALKTILSGPPSFVACMVIAFILPCLFPDLATWLPDLVMGAAV
ncbi:hypothetical protein [Ruegeria discodermiae]|uniref:hypothetical protein n=1 Tax=Ruegeria discodermiae TaxID=3064389 RepID=UPI0035318C69